MTVPVTDVVGEDIAVEEVGLETDKAEHALVVLVRVLNRSECLFCFQFKAVEEGEEQGFLDPKTYATIIWANVDEEINAIGYGLPKTCLPNGITWIYRI